MSRVLQGPRFEIARDDELYPMALRLIHNPPEKLYLIGDPHALQEGLAIVGARKATPYGRGCARRFARQAAQRGVVIISGGARGCDSEAHRAALAEGCPTVVFLGGGCDQVYPEEHFPLFQEIINAKGAVVSEWEWSYPPLPYSFRLRNRLIAGLAKATLIVEAGLPSGTFSTADEALAAGKDVLAVPGSISSPSSRGANRLIAQGATPIVDDESFQDALFNVFGLLKQEILIDGEVVRAEAPIEDPDSAGDETLPISTFDDPLLDACAAQPLMLEDLCALEAQRQDIDLSQSLMREVGSRMTEYEMSGLVIRQPDGRFMVAVLS